MNPTVCRIHFFYLRGRKIAPRFLNRSSGIETAKSVPTRRKCLPFRGRCRHCRRKRTLPSPNSARNLYFLRRVGRLLMIIQASGNLSRRLAPLSPKGKAFSQSAKTFCFSDSADFIISFRLNWGKCRPRPIFNKIT